MNNFTFRSWAAAALLVGVQMSFAAAPASHGGGSPPTRGVGGGFGGAVLPGASTAIPQRVPADRTPGMGTYGQPDLSRGMHADPATLLQQNTQLATKLQPLLPAGTTTQQACSGFRDLGGCVAALHVANNLAIPFAGLKARITGHDAASLGAAIGELRPTADARRERRRAERQARNELAARAD